MYPSCIKFTYENFPVLTLLDLSFMVFVYSRNSRRKNKNGLNVHITYNTLGFIGPG